MQEKLGLAGKLANIFVQIIYLPHFSRREYDLLKKAIWSNEVYARSLAYRCILCGKFKLDDLQHKALESLINGD